MKPIAECHSLLKGLKIDPSQIVYKNLAPEHIEEIKKLYIEWYPIKYQDKYFEDVFVKNNGAFFTLGAYYKVKIGENDYKEALLGLIVGCWNLVDKYFFENTDKSLAKEIIDSLNYEDEVKFFLSKYKNYFTFYIHSIGVIDECRKMGVGTQLLKSVLNVAIANTFCVGIYLNVISTNNSGKKFYEKNKLKCIKQIKGFYDIDGQKYDSDIYVRIFTRNEKTLRDNYNKSKMPFKAKLLYYCLKKPFYFIVYIFMLVFLMKCFRKTIKTE